MFSFCLENIYFLVISYGAYQNSIASSYNVPLDKSYISDMIRP